MVIFNIPRREKSDFNRLVEINEGDLIGYVGRNEGRRGGRLTYRHKNNLVRLNVGILKRFDEGEVSIELRDMVYLRNEFAELISERSPNSSNVYRLSETPEKVRGSEGLSVTLGIEIYVNDEIIPFMNEEGFGKFSDVVREMRG
jgi:hypothetical protein